MPLYTLSRSFDPDWTEQDFDKMMRRAVAGLSWHPPVYWRRSYGIDREGPVEGFCVYQAETLRHIQQQQRVCWIPFTEAREVQEACRPGVGLGPFEAPDGQSLFLVERTFGEDMTLPCLVESNLSLAWGGVTWIRSFWDAQRKSSRCIFAAESSSRVAEALGGEVTVLPVVEGHPSELVEMYDQWGIEHSWEEPVPV